MIRRSLQEARLDALDVSYVLAHGTGTALGDPIEAGALKAVYGAGRSADRPLVATSIKPNIGHLEDAAGVANTIKAVLALQYGEAPGIVNLKKPNPYISMDCFAAIFPMENTRLQALDNGQLYVGTSSFGFRGKNAHAVASVIEDLPTAKRLI